MKNTYRNQLFCISRFAMVIPLIGEAAWVKRLRNVPNFVATDAPMLVVVPHPDDETLAAGGLIAAQRERGIDVTVVAVTDGEHAYAENDGLAALRSEEQARALATLGVSREKIVRLGFVDSSVAAQERELAARLAMLITPDTLVVAPWHGDFHPDHEACARAAGVAAKEVGAIVISYFFWTWHRGILATLEGLTVAKFQLNEQLMLAKRDALACHASQLKNQNEPEILPENLLWPARLPFEVFAL